jgi:hypothetical protein
MIIDIANEVKKHYYSNYELQSFGTELVIFYSNKRVTVKFQAHTFKPTKNNLIV